MNKLIRYFCQRSFLVNLISVFLILGGLLALKMTRTDMMPEMARPTIEVTGNMPGASAIQLERYVVRPLESALGTIANVEKLSSNISKSAFTIKLDFNASYDDLLSSKDEIETAVRSAESSLPDSLEDLTVTSAESRRQSWMGSLNIIGLATDNPESRFITEQVMEEIRSVPGIISTYSELERKRLLIKLNEKKLAQSGLKSENIVSNLRAYLSPKYGGTVKKDSDRISVEIKDAALSLESLSKMPVLTNSYGSTFLLEDIADFEWRVNTTPTMRRVNGSVYTRFWVFKDRNTDILNLDEKLRAKIESINKGLLADKPYKLVASRLAADFVKHQIDNLKNNALLGMILVILLLGYFLGIKTALITAFSVPLAYATAMVVFSFLGMSINIVSLLALILVLGLLVDDAIIVAEKYTQNREAGDPPLKSAVDSASQLLTPVTATIATTAIAFLPILGIDGFLKEMFFSIPIVVCATLLASWFESFFILPNHLSDFLKEAPKKRKLMGFLETQYHSVLKVALKFRYLLLIVLALLAASSVWVGTEKIKSKFHLRFGSSSIRITASLKDSPSLEYTESKLKDLENYLLKLKKEYKEISEVSLKIGRVWLERERKEHPRYASLDLDIESSSSGTEKFKQKLQEKIKKYLKNYKEKELFERLSVSKKNNRSNENLDSTVSVYFYGKSSEGFQKQKEATEKKSSELDHFLSFNYDDDALSTAWVFDPKLGRLNALGLGLSDLSTQLALYTENIKVGDTFFGDEELSIYASIGNLTTDPEFSKLKQINLLSSQNILIPIRQLGTWKETQGFDSIYREDSKRVTRFDIQFDPEKTDLLKFQKQIDEKILPSLKSEFPSYTVSTKAANEDVEENRKSIFEITALCIIGILFILALQLGSITQPILVASVIPFGAFGAIWALYLHGLDMGLMAMIGLLGVAGVAVNDAIVMVDQCNIEEKKLTSASKKDNAYILKAAKSRLRAILLTTITTLGGLFPMAYGIGGDSGLTRPLAFTMGWGLLGSTILTLIALPTFLAIGNDCKNLWTRRRSKK